RWVKCANATPPATAPATPPAIAAGVAQVRRVAASRESVEARKAVGGVGPWAAARGAAPSTAPRASRQAASGGPQCGARRGARQLVHELAHLGGGVAAPGEKGEQPAAAQPLGQVPELARPLRGHGPRLERRVNPFLF